MNAIFSYFSFNILNVLHITSINIKQVNITIVYV